MANQRSAIASWVNGVQTHGYSNVNFQASPWTEYQVNPTYGGVGGTPGQDQDFFYDDIHISTASDRCGG